MKPIMVTPRKSEAAGGGTRAAASPSSLTWMSLAIGLAAGFGEVALMMWQKHFKGRVGVFPDSPWQTPLLYALLALVICMVVAACARWLPRSVSWQAAVFVPLAVCTVSLLGFQFPRLHPAALTVLACGIAAQGARLLWARQATAVRTARWLTLFLLALAGLTAVFVVGKRWRTERQAWAALPDARSGSMNVLLLILDTVGAQHLSLYGYGRPTSPELDRWARRGVTFERAIVTAPWTLPSHASMMTGRYPHELRYNWFRPVRLPTPRLADAFRERGYATGAFIANYHYLGADYGLAPGFLHYEVPMPAIGTFVQEGWLARRLMNGRTFRRLVGTDQDRARPSAATINRRLLAWLDGDAAGRPYFAFLNYFDAHKPYVPPHDVFRRIAGYERRNNLDPLGIRRYAFATRRTATSGEIRLSRDMYDAAIAAQDRDMGALLDGLERRGLLRNTLVIIASDHGEEFGEHGVFEHGVTLHSTSLHVPLVVIAPGVPAGIRIAEPVTLRDLAATVTDLSALPVTTSFPGFSLARTWRGDSLSAPAHSPVLSEVKRGIRFPPWYPNSRDNASSIIIGALHYIRIDDGRQQLFDWFKDPGERNNLIGTPVADSAAYRLRTALDSARATGRRR